MWTCAKCNEQIEDTFDACWNCGTNAEGAQNPNFQTAEEVDCKSSASAAISKVCPSCGSGNYSTTRPKGWVTFSEDRICKSCNTRYSPPTPWWAAILLMCIGGVLTIGCAASLMLRFTSGRLPNFVGAVPEAVLCFIGIAAIRQGLQAKKASDNRR